MVAGFVAPSRGPHPDRRRGPDALPAHRRNIGVVFQSYALFPHLTAIENVAFGLRMRQLPARPSAARAPARRWRWSGCPHLADRYPAPALRRAAAARGARPRAGDRAARAAARRAPVQPRRRICAPRCAPRSARCSSASITTALRHPRPGRGAGDGRPRRGDERGQLVEVGDAAGAVRPPRHPFTASFLGARTVIAGPRRAGRVRAPRPAPAAARPTARRHRAARRPPRLRRGRAAAPLDLAAPLAACAFSATSSRPTSTPRPAACASRPLRDPPRPVGPPAASRRCPAASASSS